MWQYVSWFTLKMYYIFLDYCSAKYSSLVRLYADDDDDAVVRQAMTVQCSTTGGTQPL